MMTPKGDRQISYYTLEPDLLKRFTPWWCKRIPVFLAGFSSLVVTPRRRVYAEKNSGHN
jgi:hypothetical protein